MTDNKNWKNAKSYTIFASWFTGNTVARRIREFESWDDCVRSAKRSKKTVDIKILATFDGYREYVPEEVWQN